MADIPTSGLGSGSGSPRASRPALFEAVNRINWLADRTDPAKGLGQLGQSYVVRYGPGTAGNKSQDFLTTRDVGLTGDPGRDGDRTPQAFQDAADWIAKKQNEVDQLSIQRVLHSTFRVSQGLYFLDRAIQWFGMVNIIGDGAALVGGSTIVMTKPNLDIFRFNGWQLDHRSLAATVAGLTFGFSDGSSANGFALRFPGNDIIDSSSRTPGSSLYIRNNRMGAFWPYGGFVNVNHGGDIEITGNVIDASPVTTIQLGDPGRPTVEDGLIESVLIADNGFFQVKESILLQHCGDVNIVGNRFFANQYSNSIGIRMGTGSSARWVEHVNISDNTFSNIAGRSIVLDNTTRDITIHDNKGRNLGLEFIEINTSAMCSGGLSIRDNMIQPAVGYTRPAMIISEGASLENVVIRDNEIDTRGQSIELINDTGTSSYFGENCSVGDNVFMNHPIRVGGGQRFLMSMAAKDNEWEGFTNFGGTYPTLSPILVFGTMQPGDSCTFELQYSVVVSGTETGTASGRLSIQINKLLGNPAFVPEVLASDTRSTGGAGAPPIVSFSLVNGPPIALTVAISSVIAASSIQLKYKVLNVEAIGSLSARIV